MLLNELVQKRQDLSCDILKCLHEEVLSIKLSAEDMLECATNIKGQGYSMFIKSRETFLAKIDSLQDQITASMHINTCAHH